VRTSYHGFSMAAPSERTLAFVAYEAALDREESAAQIYADQVSLVSSSLAEAADGEATTGARSVGVRASTGSAWPWRW
jgi:hypothetical protein